ncbi:MAG: YggS family pyridoxal phosphate-dependent enzyme [Bacteroidota bacterium]
MIRENLRDIHAEIEAAAKAAHRDPSEIKLIAVSKTKPMDLIRECAEAGQLDFGENRVQELAEKQATLSAELPDIRWHMIGSLQRNKVRQIAEFVHLIHSVDSERLLAEIEKQAAKYERNIQVLLQLNISDESQKGGFQEDECEALLKRMEEFPHVQVRGLMGMAAFTADMDVVQGQFRRLKAASERFKAVEGPQVEMAELSMGMSGDFPEAIAEGATMIRVGSRIFGSRY